MIIIIIMDIDNEKLKEEYVISQLTNKIYMTDKYKTNDTNVAKYINENITDIKMNDNLLFSIIKKIIPREKMIKEIITYEFVNFEPEKKTNDMTELISIAINQLKLYQYVVGGSCMEDIDWIIADEKSRFKPKKDQMILYNTAERQFCFEKDQTWFLRHFVKRMKKYVDKDSINIDYKIIDDEYNNICWVMIVFEPKSKK